MTSRYLLRRLLQVVPTAAAILISTWLLLHLAPGDPLVALAGQHGDEAYYAAMRERFGLDQPLPQQLLTYVSNVVRGDLGESFVRGRPALAVVLERLPATLLLAGSALVVSTVVGVGLGMLTAQHSRGPIDILFRAAALIGYAAPSFWLAQLAVLVLAFGAGWFPVQGMTDARASAVGMAGRLDVLQHLALPTLVLATTEVALNMRLVRTSLLEIRGTEYMRTARAKGLSSRRVLRHGVRNALLPLATVIGSRVGMFFTGAALVEIVFAWPGVGRLLLSAAQARDYPVLLTIFLLVSAAVVLVNLATDVVYAYLDPRIRYE